MHRLLRNPLFIYILGFAFSFLVYGLGWSELYPPLSTGMKVFFAVTFTAYLVLGALVGILKLTRRTLSQTRPRLVRSLSIVLFVLYALEFLVEKDVPFFSKLMGRAGVGYMEFGIPLLHGILISFNSFLIAHTFTMYMSTKSRKLLMHNILLYLPALLFFNRSILVFGLLTSLFIYLHFVEKVRLVNMGLLAGLIFISLYLFGVLGNLRSGGEYIYVQSKATEEFMESPVPKEFYWTYLYAASPLANFQNTVNRKSVEEYDFIGFLFYENLPQIISKNLGEHLHIEQRDLVRIVPWLTVGTTYARSFSYLGWLGPYLLFLGNLMIYLAIIFILVPRGSSYRTTTIAILSAIILMNLFSNMLVVTGISFQLVYCVIFSFFEEKKIVYKI